MSKTDTKGNSQRTRRKRSWKGNIPLVLVVSILLLFLIALGCWKSFWYCAFIPPTLTFIYLTFKLTEPYGKNLRRYRKQPKLTRDIRYIPPRLRQSVWGRCKGRCVQCKSTFLLEYDHIIPLSKGGATSYNNLQILCRNCNRQKSNHI
jgi:hypothetical protein